MFKNGIEGYGVRRVPYFKGTTFSTEYGDFFEYVVQGVRGTKSTKVRMRVPDGHGMTYGQNIH